MKVINLFGQPGAGKSTTAAALFSKMKYAGMKVELVTEYAKQMVYQERHNVLAHSQTYIFAKQLDKLEMLVGKVDYVVTDSPILLSSIYAPSNYPPSFFPFVLDMFKRFTNVNYYIRRCKAYQTFGRTQDEKQSDAIGDKILKYLVACDVKFFALDGNEEAPLRILNDIRRL